MPRFALIRELNEDLARLEWSKPRESLLRPLIICVDLVKKITLTSDQTKLEFAGTNIYVHVWEKWPFSGSKTECNKKWVDLPNDEIVNIALACIISERAMPEGRQSTIFWPGSTDYTRCPLSVDELWQRMVSAHG